MSLCLSEVTLTYPDGGARLTALDRVSLTAPAGTVTGVLGPSGSGKSSLLAVAAALKTPDAGRVVIAGTDTTGLRRAQLTALRRETVGVVFQQPHLIASLTAREQLQLMADIPGRSTRAARDRADLLLDVVGLRSLAARRPHQLSGGQRQRVNIARALMNDPLVLLVDEPTSALDHERGNAIIDLLVDLTGERGIATVLVTHDRGHLDRIERIVEMDDGRLRSAVPA